MIVALYIACLFKVVYCQSSYPNSVYVPNNAISDVSFTCNGIPELEWKVNGTMLNFGNPPPGISVMAVSNGMLLSQTLTAQQASVLSYNGSSFQCTTKGDNFTSVPTAFIIVYGPPSEPGDLSSESVSDGILVFSWSPPWAPDGVQLNYTVTVTNTNTSVVRNYTTSNTSITLTRSDVEGDGECDQYVWSVTAVNPAGISGPANYTTALTMPSAPVGGHFNLSYSNTSILFSLQGLRCLNNHPTNFTVVAENICDNKPAIFVLLPMNGTVLFVAPKSHNWSNITFMVENMYGVHELSHSFDELNRTVDCPATPEVVSSSTAYHEFTQSILFTSSRPMPSNLPPSTTEEQLAIGVFVTAGVVAVLLIALLIVTVVITIMCYMRKNNSARRKNHKLNTVDIGLVSQTSEKTGEQVMEDKSMTSPSVSPRQLLPEYMTPADAMKEAKIVRRQSDGIGYLQTQNKTSQDADSSEDNVFQNITPSATMPEMKVVDTGHYSAVWNHKNTSSKATASPIGKNIKRHSSYSYKLTRPTVSPPQRNYVRTSSAGSAEPLQTAPGPYLQHIPLYSDHSNTSHNTSNPQAPTPSKYANVSSNVALTLLSGNIGASNGQSSQASSHYNHLLPSPVPSPTSSGGKSSSVFTDSSHMSCNQPLPLPGELAPSPTLPQSDGSQASQSSQVIQSTSSRSSSRMSSNRPLPRLPGEPDGNASPLLLDHTSTSPYAVTHTPPSSQYTGTNQPLPPLPGEPLADGSSFQDHFDYNHTPTNSHSYKTHNTQDLSHLQDHSPVTFSITDKNTSESYNNTDEQNSPQIDSAWYLN